MITANGRGVIAGGEEGRNHLGPGWQDDEIKLIAHQTFIRLCASGYVHIQPETEFIAGFISGFKCANVKR